MTAATVIKTVITAAEAAVVTIDPKLFHLWVPLNLFSTWLVFLFHSCSWTVIAWQKYIYISRRNTEGDAAIESSAPPVVLAWPAFAAELLLAAAVSVSAATALGFPAVLVSEMTVPCRLAVIGAATTASSVPDVISAAFFVALRRRAAKKVTVVGPAADATSKISSVTSSLYCGIYVGPSSKVDKSEEIFHVPKLRERSLTMPSSLTREHFCCKVLSNSCPNLSLKRTEIKKIPAKPIPPVSKPMSFPPPGNVQSSQAMKELTASVTALRSHLATCVTNYAIYFFLALPPRAWNAFVTLTVLDLYLGVTSVAMAYRNFVNVRVAVRSLYERVAC